MPAPKTVVTDLAAVRRAAVAAQGLCGTPPRSSPDAVVRVAERLRCLQIDPISVVAPTQELVLAARLDGFERAHLDDVLWARKELFHYFAHAASLVLTADYPIHRRHMRAFARAETPSARRARDWMEANAALRRHVLRRLRRDGPLRARDIEDRSARLPRNLTWPAARGVPFMLELLWARGEVMIAGRDGGARVWDLAERWLPEWTPRAPLGPRRAVELKVLHSLRALGVATRRHVNEHFTRRRYPGLADALARLERRGEIVRVDVTGPAREPWYVRRDDVGLLDARPEPRTVLLSPFDNLLCDRSRTRAVFGFDYTIEIYVPKARRRFGYYVLPVLHGDALVGRVDAAADRRRGVLHVHAVHAEPAAPGGDTGAAVGSALRRLAAVAGATDVALPRGLPRPWARGLRSSA